MTTVSKKYWLIFASFLILLLLVGCSPANSHSSINIPTSTQIPAATDTLPPSAKPSQLTVLYTNDEHGWMEGASKGQGADNLLGLWRDREGYTPDDSTIILSGGDNWTGPAISTWFQGQSMVEVMNAMGYAASTIGNHEFDFGLDVLKQRISKANFPYVSANVRYKRDNSTPTDLGIQPYVVVDKKSLLVGITGLTTYDATTTANPAYTKDFTFMNYEAALREVVPQMRAAGAEIILVAAHVCPEELVQLADAIRDLDIAFLGAGHCELPYSKLEGNTVIVTGKPHFAGYGYASLEYDPSTQQTKILRYGLAENKGGTADQTVSDIITHWEQETDAQLSVQIGYLKQPLLSSSSGMRALVVESWLFGYPTADVAITNSGGFRDDLKAGPVTLADVINVMPFDNVIVDIKLTGQQLTQVLNTNTSAVVGGAHRSSTQWVLNKTGQALDPEKTYTVLVNDFMYNGGDNYTLLAKFDPQGENTGISWRQPVIDWIRAQKTTPAQPLDEEIKALSETP